jgi:hypothetical protein
MRESAKAEALAYLDAKTPCAKHYYLFCGKTKWFSLESLSLIACVVEAEDDCGGYEAVDAEEVPAAFFEPAA